MPSGPPRPPLLLLRDAPAEGPGGWLLFRRPRAVLATTVPGEVPALLGRLDAALASGLAAAGFLSYEAAPGLDPALAARPPGRLPVAWFGLFDGPEPIAALPETTAPPPAVGPWRATVGEAAYGRAVAAVRAAIARGETYQVNYSFRLRARFSGDPLALFRRLWESQAGPSSAFVDLGEHALCSASPELFFRLDGESVTTRPMKGTAARGRTSAEDARRRGALRRSPKNRAENLMIVDMLRNDLGRVARPGSVAVRQLFAVERYDSLFQLVSEVRAECAATVGEILGALFPCASVTGAPKASTMRRIARLETAPRGIYTGTIGYALPAGPGGARRAAFNVAIRTVHVDRAAGRAEYGTGGGIVWDSHPARERAECLTKARVLVCPRPRFSLLETLRFRPPGGFFLLALHLRRLASSARYFGFPFDSRGARRRLAAAVTGRTGPGPLRVRLLLGPGGAIEVEAEPLAARKRRWRVALDDRPVDDTDRFLFHKTTWRLPYEAARARFPEHDDVLLWNRRGELTESTVANLVVRIAGRLVTPPLACGLLAGTYRADLLRRGRLSEQVLTRRDLGAAQAVYLVNSLRGWFRADLDP